MNNVLLCIVDDVGWDYADRLPFYTDPSFQAFTRFYVSPTCSSTRARFLTGHDAYHTGVGSAFKRDSDLSLSNSFVTLPEVMPQHRSAIFGKWHLGDSTGYESPFTDTFEKGYRLAKVTRHNIDDYQNYELHTNTRLTAFSRNVSKYATTQTVDDCLSFIDVSPDPWFITASFHAPHSPYHVPPAELIDPATPTGTDQEKFEAALEALGNEMERLISQVPFGTSILIVSDNGSPKEFGGGKGDISEAGMNVPMWIKAPAGFHELHELITATDLFIFLQELAGYSIPCPAADALKIGERNFVYSEFFKPLEGPPYDIRHEVAMFDGRYRLHRDKITLVEDVIDTTNGQSVDPTTIPSEYAALTAELNQYPDPTGL